MYKDEAYREMESDHLALLTNAGLKFLEDAEAVVTMLRLEFEESELSDEKKEFFNQLIRIVIRHKEIIRKTIQERQDYIDAHEKPDKPAF